MTSQIVAKRNFYGVEHAEVRSLLLNYATHLRNGMSQHLAKA